MPRFEAISLDEELNKSKLNKSAESDEKSKSNSSKDELFDVVETLAVGSLIISAMSSSIERVCVLSLVLDNSSSASVADIIARISSADKPT